MINNVQSSDRYDYRRERPYPIQLMMIVYQRQRYIFVQIFDTRVTGSKRLFHVYVLLRHVISKHGFERITEHKILQSLDECHGHGMAGKYSWIDRGIVWIAKGVVRPVHQWHCHDRDHRYVEMSAPGEMAIRQEVLLKIS